MSIGIYSILNTKNNMRYVGSTTEFPTRCKTHFYLLRRNKHHSSRLQKAWNLDGEKVFQYYLLEEVSDLTLLLSREKYWMDYYKSCNPEFGYNISSIPGGFGMLGLILNRETGRMEEAPPKDSPEWEMYIQSAKDARAKYYEEHKQKIDDYLKEYTEEHWDTIREWQKEWRDEHRLELQEYDKEYYQEHREEIKFRTKERIRKIQAGEQQVQPRKQICKRGHDTFVTGRNKWGACVECEKTRKSLTQIKI